MADDGQGDLNEPFSIELHEFLEIISRLTQAGPDLVACQAFVETFAKTPQVLGDGNEAFSGRACFMTEIPLLGDDIFTSSQEHIANAVVSGFEVILTPKT